MNGFDRRVKIFINTVESENKMIKLVELRTGFSVTIFINRDIIKDKIIFSNCCKVSLGIQGLWYKQLH
jgi:hypothetical protein